MSIMPPPPPPPDASTDTCASFERRTGLTHARMSFVIHTTYLPQVWQWQGGGGVLTTDVTMGWGVTGKDPNAITQIDVRRFYGLIKIYRKNYVSRQESEIVLKFWISCANFTLPWIGDLRIINNEDIRAIVVGKVPKNIVPSRNNCYQKFEKIERLVVVN